MAREVQRSRLAQGIAAVWVVALTILALWSSGCERTHQRLVECAGTEALKVLPEDPMQATAADAVDLAHRLNTCRYAPDGGAQ